MLVIRVTMENELNPHTFQLDCVAQSEINSEV